MRKQSKTPEPAKSAFDLVELITGRIGKITALVAAIGGLALGILKYSGEVRDKLVQLHLYTPPPCLQVDDLILPATVKFSQWDNMRIKLKGRNNCSANLGLYVTFVRRTAVGSLIRLKVPHEDLPECKGTAPLLVPNCWDQKKPISLHKGDWEWEIRPPPLEPLGDPRDVEKISVTWAARDYDDPTKPVIGTDSAEIEVRSDAGNAS